MGQFRIKGIDYVDDSLQHGLGKGSGRGRPKGSKNGQVMPGAAYMKDYKIIGQKAAGDELFPDGAPTAKDLSRRTINARNASNRSYGRTTTGSGNRALPRTTNGRAASTASTPTANVARGKAAVNQLMGGSSLPEYKADPGYIGGRSERPGQTNPAQTRIPSAPQGSAKPNNVSPEQRTAQNSRNETPSALTEYKVDPGHITGRSERPSQDNRQETPEQKSIWDSIGGWFAQAGKDIADTAVGAWNAASGAVNDAAKWVGDRLNDAGDWAQTAYSDVSDWVGARGKEFGDWLDNARVDATNAGLGVRDWITGRDVTRLNDEGKLVRERQPGVLENIGNAFNTAGQWIGNAANDVGRTINGAVDAAGQWIGNAANDVSNFARDAVNGAGQWIGDRVTDADRFLNGYDVGSNAVFVNNDAARVPGSQQYKPQHVNGFLDNAGQWISDAPGNISRAAGDAFNAAGQWIGNAYNDASRAVGDAANGISQWAGDTWNNISRAAGDAVGAADRFLNGYDVGSNATFVNNDAARVSGLPQNKPQHVNGFLDNAGNLITDTAGNIGRAAGDIWNNISRAAGDTVDAADRFLNGYDPGSNAVIVDNAAARVPGSVPRMPQHVNGFLDNAGQAINDGFVTPVRNAFDTAGQFVRNTVDDASRAANNAYNTASQWVGDTWDNAGRALNDAWNGTDTTIFGIPVAHTPGIKDHIGNILNGVGQTVGNVANGIGNAVSGAVNTASQAAGNVVDAVNIYNQAVSAGVPVARARQLANQYASGQITPEEYTYWMQSAINYARANQ